MGSGDLTVEISRSEHLLNRLEAEALGQAQHAGQEVPHAADERHHAQQHVAAQTSHPQQLSELGLRVLGARISCA